MNNCKLCDAPVYIKEKQYIRPALAPLTRADELRYELLGLTGEMYVEVPKKFCPFCGNRFESED